MKRGFDGVLVAGVLLLVGAAAADALRHHHAPAPVAAPLRGLPADHRSAVSLHTSPDVAFLPECVSNRIRLSLTSTVVNVRYVGPPCRLAGALRTTLRAADGELLYRGAAARISENVAGRTVLRRALLPDLPRCTSRAPYAVVVVAFGHAAHGSLACRLDFSEQ